jgi:hypothetical protein
MPRDLQHRPLALVEDEILDGDLLLFRGSGWVANAIQWGGRSEYSHAALAADWFGQVMCLEVREWVGGRAVTLASQVKKYPGAIDVYRADTTRHPEYIRKIAVATMKDLAGCQYGYFSVLLAAIGHLPFLRRLVSREAETIERFNSPPYCSQAIAIAAERAGVDPVPNLDDRLTEPGDLARSSLWNYRFTLE